MKKPALIIISLSFAVGIAGGVVWGRKLPQFTPSSLYDKISFAKADSGAHPPLRVLTYKGLFTPEMKAELQTEMGNYQSSTIEMIEVDTPEELWEKIEKSGTDKAPDVVTLFSYQVPLASQLGWLQPIDRKQVSLIRTIGADFTDLPGDPSLRQVIPVLWGVNGMVLDRDQAVKLKIKGISNSWPTEVANSGAGGDTDSSDEDHELSAWADIVGNPAFKGEVGFPNSTIIGWRLANAVNNTNNNFSGEAVSGSGDGEDATPAKAKKRKGASSGGSSLAKALQPWLSMGRFSDSFWSAVPLIGAENSPLLILASNGEMAFPPLDKANWKFKLPDEKGTFWYLSFALSRETHDERQAYVFLNALLQKQMSEKFVQATHYASTNLQLERETLDARLKPSYLRSIPLNGFILWQDFSRAREIRGIMDEAKAKSRNQ